jgi:hypothetical protein
LLVRGLRHFESQKGEKMTGKPNLIQRVDSSVEMDLDEERAHSMADEGGSFPAEVEGEETELYQASRMASRDFSRALPWVGVAAALVAGAVLSRIYWSRSEPALNPE